MNARIPQVYHGFLPQIVIIGQGGPIEASTTATVTILPKYN